MIHFQTHYSDACNVECFFQKDWYFSGQDWTSETEERFGIAIVLPSEVLNDKDTQKWMEFQDLVKEWKKERGSRSSISQAAMMDPYQKIIGIGPEAIPFLLAQLKSEGDDPDQWFWALRILARENPVRPEDRGNFLKMAQAWFQWAEQRGYAW